MTELQWYFEGTTTRIIGLTADFFERKEAFVRKRRDIPSYEVTTIQVEGTDVAGVDELVRVSFRTSEGTKQAKVRAVAEGTGCRVSINKIKDGWTYIEPIWLEFVSELQNQNQIFVPYTTETEADDREALAMEQLDNRSEVKFAIDTTPAYFYNWLHETTSSEMWQKKGIKFPTDRGELQLGPAIALPKADAHSGITHIAMHGHEFAQTGDDETIAMGGLWDFECIRFTLLPVSDTRTQVTAECLQPIVKSYFDNLLGKIVGTYPETSEAITNAIEPKNISSSVKKYSVASPEKEIEEIMDLARRARNLGISQDKLERWDAMIPLIRSGLKQWQIAEQFGVSIYTIKTDFKEMRERGVFPTQE